MRPDQLSEEELLAAVTFEILEAVAMPIDLSPASAFRRAYGGRAQRRGNTPAGSHMSEKACEGGRVLEAPHDMAECAACGRCVRWDLRDHPFWGFHTCPEKVPPGLPPRNSEPAP
jgi:hypothetical protein